MEATPAAREDPLPGCYLLVVLSEPFSEDHKHKILQRVAKGLLSWDVAAAGCDLSGVGNICTNVKNSEDQENELLIQYSTETLAVEVLMSPQVSTLKQCLKNVLLATTGHKLLIHAGYAFTGTGSWILQNGTFSVSDFADAFHDADVQKVLKGQPKCIVHVHCTEEGEWTSANMGKQTFNNFANVSLNPSHKIDRLPGSDALFDCLNSVLNAPSLVDMMKTSPLVGNIRFNRPTLYVFPGGQGDCALFGISGFNMLIDGGFNRKPCSWEFIRHLDRLDAVLVTRLSESNLCGMSTMMKRKAVNNTSPQIGYVFCNIAEGKWSPSEEIQKDKDGLLISVVGEGHNFIQNLHSLKLKPHQCWRDNTMDPFVLYHKVGHGTLEMYVLSPPKDSKEMKEFLHEWSSRKEKFSCVKTGLKVQNHEMAIPLSHAMSICALLVWKPADPKDNITRILFPGSTPQSRMLEGLEKLKSLDVLKYPTCTKVSLTAALIGKTKGKVERPPSKAPLNRKNVPSPSLSTSSVTSRNGDIHASKKENKDISTKPVIDRKTPARTVTKPPPSKPHPEPKERKPPAKEHKATPPPPVKKEVKPAMTSRQPEKQAVMKKTKADVEVKSKGLKEVTNNKKVTESKTAARKSTESAAKTKAPVAKSAPKIDRTKPTPVPTKNAKAKAAGVGAAAAVAATAAVLSTAEQKAEKTDVEKVEKEQRVEKEEAEKKVQKEEEEKVNEEEKVENKEVVDKVVEKKEIEEKELNIAANEKVEQEEKIEVEEKADKEEVEEKVVKEEIVVIEKEEAEEETEKENVEEKKAKMVKEEEDKEFALEKVSEVEKEEVKEKNEVEEVEEKADVEQNVEENLEQEVGSELKMEVGSVDEHIEKDKVEQLYMMKEDEMRKDFEEKLENTCIEERDSMEDTVTDPHKVLEMKDDQNAFLDQVHSQITNLNKADEISKNVETDENEEYKCLKASYEEEKTSVDLHDSKSPLEMKGDIIDSLQVSAFDRTTSEMETSLYEPREDDEEIQREDSYTTEFSNQDVVAGKENISVEAFPPVSRDVDSMLASATMEGSFCEGLIATSDFNANRNIEDSCAEDSTDEDLKEEKYETETTKDDLSDLIPPVTSTTDKCEMQSLEIGQEVIADEMENYELQKHETEEQHLGSGRPVTPEVMEKSETVSPLPPTEPLFLQGEDAMTTSVSIVYDDEKEVAKDEMEKEIEIEDCTAVESGEKLDSGKLSVLIPSRDTDDDDDDVMKSPTPHAVVDYEGQCEQEPGRNDQQEAPRDIVQEPDDYVEDIRHNESTKQQEAELYSKQNREEDEMIRYPTPPGEQNFYERVGPVGEPQCDGSDMADPITQHFVTTPHRQGPEVIDDPLYEESEEERSESPVEEQPVYGSILKADFPEFVNISGGTTPSEPQSPKSPRSRNNGLLKEGMTACSEEEEHDEDTGQRQQSKMVEEAKSEEPCISQSAAELCGQQSEFSEQQSLECSEIGTHVPPGMDMSFTEHLTTTSEDTDLHTTGEDTDLHLATTSEDADLHLATTREDGDLHLATTREDADLHLATTREDADLHLATTREDADLHLATTREDADLHLATTREDADLHLTTTREDADLHLATTKEDTDLHLATTREDADLHLATTREDSDLHLATTGNATDINLTSAGEDASLCYSSEHAVSPSLQHDENILLPSNSFRTDTDLGDYPSVVPHFSDPNTLELRSRDDEYHDKDGTSSPDSEESINGADEKNGFQGDCVGIEFPQQAFVSNPPEDISVMQEESIDTQGVMSTEQSKDDRCGDSSNGYHIDSHLHKDQETSSSVHVNDNFHANGFDKESVNDVYQIIPGPPDEINFSSSYKTELFSKEYCGNINGQDFKDTEPWNGCTPQDYNSGVTSKSGLSTLTPEEESTTYNYESISVNSATKEVFQSHLQTSFPHGDINDRDLSPLATYSPEETDQYVIEHSKNLKISETSSGYENELIEGIIPSRADGDGHSSCDVKSLSPTVRHVSGGEDPYGVSSEEDDSSSLPESVSPHAYTNKAYVQEDVHLYKHDMRLEQGANDHSLHYRTEIPSEEVDNHAMTRMTYSPGFPDIQGADSNYEFRLEDWGKPMGLPSPPPNPGDSQTAVKKGISSKGTSGVRMATKPSDKRPSLDNVKNGTRSPMASPSKSAAKSKSSAVGESALPPVYVDLAYVPHHADPYYCNEEFFKRVRARYYVFSGTSPSKEVLNALLEAKKSWKEEMEVTIIPTYETDTLGYWMALNQDTLAEYMIDVAPSASRCTVNLQDHETSCAAYRLEF